MDGVHLKGEAIIKVLDLVSSEVLHHSSVQASPHRQRMIVRRRKFRRYPEEKADRNGYQKLNKILISPQFLRWGKHEYGLPGPCTDPSNPWRTTGEPQKSDSGFARVRVSERVVGPRLSSVPYGALTGCSNPECI